METDEVCDRPLETFGLDSLLPLVFFDSFLFWLPNQELQTVLVPRIREENREVAEGTALGRFT